MTNLMTALAFSCSFTVQLFSSHAAGACVDTQVKYFYNAKVVYKNDVICHERLSDRAWSASCEKSGKDCKIREKIKLAKIEFKKIAGPVGNPWFLACHKVGGLPQSYAYLAGRGWIEASRCIDPENSSFVDMSEIQASVLLNGI